MKKGLFSKMLCAIMGLYFSFGATVQVFAYSDPAVSDETSCKIDQNIRPCDVEFQIRPRDSLTDILLAESKNKINCMISPISIKMALMLLANGTSGISQEEILNSMGFTDLSVANDVIHDFYKNLKDNDVMDINNSVWLNEDYLPFKVRFKKEYLQTIDSFFSATANTVTNKSAVSTINGWIERTTNGRIKNMIDSSDFLSMLVNTSYFKKSWGIHFDKSSTRKDHFINRNGVAKEVDFMHYHGYLNCYADENFKMVEIPYKDCNASMYVFLPHENLENGITSGSISVEKMNNAISCKNKREVKLSLPKFKNEYKDSMTSLLKNIGIISVFNSATAGIDRMFDGGAYESYVSDVQHKTFIKVDEEGTEAAAATTIIVRCTSLAPPPRPFIFCANRPFVYLIRDNSSGEWLFVGNQSNF